MDNQVLLEIAKYIVVECNLDTGSKLYQASNSKESRYRRFQISKEMVEKKMKKGREDLEYLKGRNIYKEEAQVISFGYIHSKLEGIIANGMPRIQKYVIVQVSPRLAQIAKDLDFKLKKKILRKRLLK